MIPFAKSGLAGAFGCLLALALPMGRVAADEPASSRLRLLIETDAGGDPDDEQSLVRFLLYANEWDVEGLIANRPVARAGENRNRERTGLGIVRALVNAYGQCWTNLAQHDLRYPNPEVLLARTVAGYDDTEAGVNLILRAVDSPDPRPLWYSDWGSDNGAATNNLRRALDRVLRERGAAGYAHFKGRLRLASYDKFGEHTRTSPPWTLWVNTWQPELGGRRWYHRFSALTAKAGGFDLQRDVLTGHGPLGALYPANTTHAQKEGDTASFLHLAPTGMNDPQEPTWGSWAGRYGPREDAPGKPYFWANQTDRWHGVTNRDNTLLRWAAHLQNDFRARLDWCVAATNAANHPPTVVLNRDAGPGVLRLHAQPGETVSLDANGTTDRDGHALNFEWFAYPEAGTYRGKVALDADPPTSVRVRVPADAAGKTIHVLVAVTDRGEPPLTRYRRVVLEVAAHAAGLPGFDALFQPPPEFAGDFGHYRSPLLFRDGSPVKTPADWVRRRAELLREWHDFMGPWPPALKRPACEILSKTNRGELTQQRVRLEIAPGQTGEGWLLVPPGRGPFPAVLVVYYEPETSVGLNAKQPFRDFGLQLARRGFVTLSLGTPGGNAWKPDVGSAQCQPLSFHAYVAANAWHTLAQRTEVDATRIGVVGHSYGGKWALFAGALWDKFAAVAVSDPGIVFDEARPNVNYWEPWYLGADPVAKRLKAGVPTADNPRTGAYRHLVAAGHDLHELHALVAPRPFFVSGGSEDPASRWTALNHPAAVNKLLGFTNRVGFSQRAGHDPTEESNAQIYAFFERFLTEKADR
jgi:dienelactone hydrolase